MIVVAIAACTLGLAGMVGKARRMLARAEFHAQEDREAIDILANDGRLRFVARDTIYRRPLVIPPAVPPFEEVEEMVGQMRSSWHRRADYLSRRATWVPLWPPLLRRPASVCRPCTT